MNEINSQDLDNFESAESDFEEFHETTEDHSNSIHEPSIQVDEITKNASSDINKDDLEEQRRLEEDNLTAEEIENRKDEALRLKAEANKLFSVGEYDGAQKLYTDALLICPLIKKDERATFFANRAACHKMMDLKDLAIDDCTKALELKQDYVRCLIRRGELLDSIERYSDAYEDFKKVIELDPGNQQAKTLPEKIKEQQEKMKAEMMDQLKKLGNMVLKPFGLSTDNFKLQQDPNTGGYSVNFQR